MGNSQSTPLEQPVVRSADEIMDEIDRLTTDNEDIILAMRSRTLTEAERDTLLYNIHRCEALIWVLKR